jgi:hypothetical protein
MRDDDAAVYDPRVRLGKVGSGESRPVPKDAVHGLDSFADSWESDVELPYELVFSGWQMSDDTHPAGEGQTGYRLVHKTIRTVPSIALDLTFPNIQIRFHNGPITWGEPRFQGALSGRRAGNYMLPEWGSVRVSGTRREYNFTPNLNVNITAHQDTTPDANYVEILYRLPDGDWTHFADMLGAGRAGVASVTAMLGFMYGERLIGPLITEEVGEVFEDWHWNRLLGGRSVSIESQARAEVIDANQLGQRLKTAMITHIDKAPDERNRIRVAAQWYWKPTANLTWCSVTSATGSVSRRWSSGKTRTSSL